MRAHPRFLMTAFLFLAVILLGFVVESGPVQNADLAISHAFALQRGTAPEGLILAMQGISWIGGGIQRYVMIALLLLLLWRWSGWRSAVILVTAALLSNLASGFLKLYFARPRPDLVPHLDHVASASYPSGHAANAAVVFLTLALLVPARWRGRALALAACIIFLTGLSRVMLGVHWPSDVVGGWMLGIGFAVGAASLRSFPLDGYRR